MKKYTDTAGVVYAGGLSCIGDTPKVLFPIPDIPMLQQAITTQLDAGFGQVVVVTSPTYDAQIRETIQSDERISFTMQPKRSGTGNALRVALDVLDYITKGYTSVVAHPADMPFFSVQTLHELVDAHHEETKQRCNQIPGTITLVPFGTHRDVFRGYGHAWFHNDIVCYVHEYWCDKQNHTLRDEDLVSPCLLCVDPVETHEMLTNLSWNVSRDPSVSDQEQYVSELIALAHAKKNPFNTYVLNGNAYEAIGINGYTEFEIAQQQGLIQR